MRNRRVFLAGLTTAVLSAFGYAFYLEPGWIEQNVKRVPARRPRKRPLRVAHLSDLHASVEVPLAHIEEAFRLALDLRPDVVCLTGDFVTTASDFDRGRYIDVLKKLSRETPCYAVLGNHDGGEWAARSGWFPDTRFVAGMLAEGGVVVLQNQSVLLEGGGEPYRLAGVGDWWSNALDAPKALAVAGGEETVLVLNHNPDGKEECAPYRWDGMLCGHTHGGQVIVPLYGPPIVPVVDRRYAVGLNSYEGRWIHTSRGVGNIRGFRANCRPEVTLLQVG